MIQSKLKRLINNSNIPGKDDNEGEEEEVEEICNFKIFLFHSIKQINKGSRTKNVILFKVFRISNTGFLFIRTGKCGNLKEAFGFVLFYGQ
jgi:hypothetical protein